MFILLFSGSCNSAAAIIIQQRNAAARGVIHQSLLSYSLPVRQQFRQDFAPIAKARQQKAV
jgi:hypothetical protein